jgi:hypothetical protein
MEILPEKWRVEIVGEPLHVKRNPDGSRSLTQPFKAKWRDEVYEVETGFTTDYSSYPRALILWGVPVVMYLLEAHVLWYLLVPLLWPSWAKTDIAGVVHDKSWRDADWKMSLFEGNLFWFCAALTGTNIHTRATLPQGIAGYLALSVTAAAKTLANFKVKR